MVRAESKQPEKPRPLAQGRASHCGSIEDAVLEGRASEVCLGQVGATKQAANKDGRAQVTLGQICLGEIALRQVAPVEGGEVEVRSSKRDPSQVRAADVEARHSEIGEVHILDQHPEDTRSGLVIVMPRRARHLRLDITDDLHSVL